MQKGHKLQFNCVGCSTPVRFSVFDLEGSTAPLVCSGCSKQYVLDDPTLQRQLKKFEGLCQQILESEEILGDTSIGVDVDGKQVKIPYKLLLSRFNSSLDLTVGDQKISIIFRMEPAKDLSTNA